jgi:hypothetical protein
VVSRLQAALQKASGGQAPSEHSVLFVRKS